MTTVVVFIFFCHSRKKLKLPINTSQHKFTCSVGCTSIDKMYMRVTIMNAINRTQYFNSKNKSSTEKQLAHNQLAIVIIVVVVVATMMVMYL